MDNIGLYKQKEEEEEEEQSFPRRNLSLAANLTGAGLVGGVGMSLPYMMGTDKEYDLSRAALGRMKSLPIPTDAQGNKIIKPGDPPEAVKAFEARVAEGRPGYIKDPYSRYMKPNETLLTRYADAMGRGAQLTPFGIPTGEIMRHVRTSPRLMKGPWIDRKALEQSKFLGVPYGRWTNNLLKRVQVPMGGNKYKPVTEFLDKGVGAINPGMADYTVTSPESLQNTIKHYESFRNGPVAAVAHMMNGPRRSYALGGELEGTTYGKYFGPRFKDFVLGKSGGQVQPYEVDTNYKTHDEQLGWLSEFHASLTPAEQAEKSRVENIEMRSVREANTENYGPVIEAAADIRDKLKRAGKWIGGAAAVYALYKLVRYSVDRWNRKEEKEEKEAALRGSLFCLLKEAANRDIIPNPLKSILENAELVGSRGRARKYGQPEPEGRDHDYAVFSDDSEEQDKYLKLLRQLGGAGYKLRDRPGGFLTASGNNTDLSIYPTSKRDSIHKAWELMEGGMSKEDAWEHVNKQANDNSYLSTLAPKWSDKSHIVAALRDHLTDASGALDTELEAKEIADLALITDAYRRAHVPQELMDKRKAKFEEYAASPSMGTVKELLTRYESGGRGTWDVGKEKMPEELLQQVLESKAWLKRPELPEGEYTSYFTPSGAEQYEKTLLPIHRKYLSEIVKKQQGRPDTEPAYEDEHQVLYTKKAEDEENWYVATSGKVGKGLFAEKDFEVGDKLFHAGEKDEGESGLIDWEMTEASMATNHDRDPNVIVTKDGDTLTAVARKPIQADDEVFVSYFQVTHALGPGSRLTHNGKAVPTRSVEELEKWARQEKVDWAGIVHGNA